MQAIFIRHAEATDNETVSRLVHALLNELAGGKGPTLELVIRTAEMVLEDEGVVALLAFSNEEPIGLLVLNECLAIYAGGKFGEISELCVKPDNRSQGVAALLLERAQAEAKTRGWKRLEVGAPDQPAWKRTLDFYLRNGFEEVARGFEN